jgi:hypothetical protein
MAGAEEVRSTTALGQQRTIRPVEKLRFTYGNVIHFVQLGHLRLIVALSKCFMLLFSNANRS